ncbi:DUF732 domain-containing protein [[Mycobacterium] burgundiense]|uniref:DUF732 domain-containing protein n=1 Tax=[Mycobacterium] burgundiense TaxID=3064286 RepID=A0ABM9M116_9MYCO|nr:DUF732 domain-containing protein [Mycolicibacterium sp. MU0053]CAJ1508278.1 DUF732 domain-containing protein [Mycolicibacterium sp. MU0053]
MEHRRRTHRSLVALLTAAGVGAALLGAGAAHAGPDDQRFTDAVSKMGIQMSADVDLPKVGRDVCEMLTSGRARTIDPVPTVRGVVNTLEKSGLTRGQAVSLMRASVVVYCPEHGSVAGR